MPRGYTKITRQIRLDPDVEEKVQQIADFQRTSFSGCCNWLLSIIVDRAYQDIQALHSSHILTKSGDND